MINIYMIVNRQNGHKYLGSDVRPLNKVWREILEKYELWNGSLYNTMKYYGPGAFSIKIVEEVNENRLEERMKYWSDRYSPEYNEAVIAHETVHVDNKESYRRGERKWGYNRKHKPKKKSNKIVLKCRNLETGKLKTIYLLYPGLVVFRGAGKGQTAVWPRFPNS